MPIEKEIRNGRPYEENEDKVFGTVYSIRYRTPFLDLFLPFHIPPPSFVLVAVASGLITIRPKRASTIRQI